MFIALLLSDIRFLHIWPLLASTDLATITALSLALSRTTIKRFEFNLLFTLYLEWTN